MEDGLPSGIDEPEWYYYNLGYYPQNMVSYGECLDFISKLNELTGHEFSLPTEAQWEYAARGGNKSKGYLYSGSNDPSEVGWCYENDANEPNIVCTMKPNELGLYDMTGNVMEWCADYYGPYTEEAQVNPTGPASGEHRVMRGGSVINFYDESRVSHRVGGEPNSHFFFVGFRLVLKAD